MAPAVIAIGGAIVDGVIKWWHRREETRALEHETEVQVAKAEAEARINYVRTAQMNDAAWEIESIKQNGWKDELLTIVICIPLVGCFVPGMDVYVQRGFASLQSTPEWYQWAVIIVIGSAFGVKKIIDVFTAKKAS